MSKRAGKKRTPEIEREQFEAYGEYTYDYLHAQDGEAGDAQARPNPAVQAGPACTETAQDARVF